MYSRNTPFFCAWILHKLSEQLNSLKATTASWMHNVIHIGAVMILSILCARQRWKRDMTQLSNVPQQHSWDFLRETAVSLWTYIDNRFIRWLMHDMDAWVRNVPGPHLRKARTLPGHPQYWQIGHSPHSSLYTIHHKKDVVTMCYILCTNNNVYAWPSFSSVSGSPNAMWWFLLTL